MGELGRISFFTKGCLACAMPGGVAPARGTKCVVETDYGLDIGTYMSVAAEADAGEAGSAKRPRVLRAASEQDLARAAENATVADQALRTFVGLMEAAGVFIKPLMAHFTLNRERLLIVFGAPEHIDCRKAVGKLQWDLGTRVEVRHVGVRDEAAVAGGIGPCGRTLCCASWLRNFRSVNVRMAKAQEMSLNPIAINGCCGRLKCCLRYEYEVYQESGSTLPADGTVVRWGEYEGIVVGRDVLRRQLLVRTREHGMQHVAADELAAAAAPAPAPPTEGDAP